MIRRTDFFALALLVFAVFPNAGCVNKPLGLSRRYIPDSTSVNMSVAEARRQLTTCLKGNSYITDVRFTSNDVFVISQGKEYRKLSKLSELPQISAHTSRIWVSGQDTELLYVYSCGSTGLNKLKLDMKLVADSIYVLQQHAIKQKKAIDEFDARFTASLADYRAKASSGEPLPEEIVKYKVQAEGAVRDKKLDEAAELFSEALKIVPWWSVGHYNRALVLGEAGDYELATREMNYFLQLVPDSANARTAQDKIYDWERKAGK